MLNGLGVDLKLAFYSHIIRSWGLFKVPFIFLLRPQVKQLDDKSCSIMIPLNRLTKNHVDSMYISVLVSGADLAAGVLAKKVIYDRKHKVSLIFKDLKADFKKRAEQDTLFVCDDGDLIAKTIDKAIASQERQQCTCKILAFSPIPQRTKKKTKKTEPVAIFQLTLSVKLTA